jgi:hypothetical protein
VLVFMPQAVGLVIPSLVTQLVALPKDSTLGYVVELEGGPDDPTRPGAAQGGRLSRVYAV